MRLADWTLEYHRAIANARLVPFQWGVHDCVMFAAYVVDSITDLGVIRQLRSSYRWTNATEAAVIIRTAGSLSALTDRVLGTSVPWAQTGLGDVVLAMDGEREVLCINDGHCLLVAAGVGITSLPMTASQCGWKV